MSNRKWTENLSLAKSLFPKWAPSAAETDLFTARFQYANQDDVRTAIENAKIDAGRFNTLTIQGIIERLPRREDGQQSGCREPFDQWISKLPEDRQWLVTLYQRISNSGSREQWAIVSKRLDMIGGEQTLWNNPLDLDPSEIIDDSDLPDLLVRWIRYIEETTQPVSPERCMEMRKATGRYMDRVWRGVKAKIAPPNPLNRRKELMEQALALSEQTECLEPEEIQ